MEYGTLRVTTPDGQVREYPIEVQSVVIGRAEGSGVVIDHVSVSRRHAQLRVDGEKVSIEDLGSAGGTFVGSQRLSANTPTEVDPGASIRLGDVEARFLLPQAEAPASDEDAGPVTTSSDSQATIAVSLKSPAAPVAAGSATTATIAIQNRGQTVDQLAITVPDIPAAWVRVSRPQLSLVAGARDEVTIIIQPPRASEAKAGEMAFAVAVESREHRREVRVLGKFTILPFESAALTLEQARGSADARLTAENKGNSPIEYSLSGSDENGALDYRFEQESLELKPGDRVTVPLRAAPKKRPLFGRISDVPYRVVAKPARAGSAELSAAGQVSIRPPLRNWRYPLALIVVLAVLGGGAITYRSACSGGWPGCGKAETKKATPETPVPGATSGSPVATTAATGLRKGGTAIVVNSAAPNDCLLVREYHTRRSDDPRSKALGKVCNDQRLKILSDRVDDEGYFWWQVDAGGGLTGWAAERLSNGTGLPYLISAD